MIPRYGVVGGARGGPLILKEGDAFSYVPEPKYTDFQQKITSESFRNDF